MVIKPSCKSQYIAIAADEILALLEKGYSKKAIYNYFTDRGDIKMSYPAWTIILKNRTEENPFRRSEKTPPPSLPEPSHKQPPKFKHDNTPYKSSFKPQEKEELKVNLISKKTLQKEGNSWPL